MDLLDDATLFEKIQTGSAEAFEVLYDRYNGLVYTFALRSCNDIELANEITQDVFVRLWTTSAEYRPELSQFRTWILTITRRITYDKLRQQGKRSAVVIELHGNVVAHPQRINISDPDIEVIQQWFRQDVVDALQSLHAEERTIIELAYFRQLTLREVAQQMNRPLGTIKTRLHKALRVLRETMPEWKGGVHG